MATFGNYALIAALVVNLYCAVAFVTGFLLRRPRLVESAQGGMRAIFLLVTAASAALVYALMTHDFRIEYVAAYSSRDMPAPYLFAAWWGGQNGSMLFWAWILGLYALIVSFYRRRHPELIPYVLMVLNFNLTLFLGLMASANNPFRLLPFVPNDGNGLNPLLQNPTMVIHPPMLYLGYVGFVVPFAFCMAALLSGRLGDEWIKATRRWTILSWFFLGVGMLLGGRWAYVELGWGGYWAWDPVENASFMPWLTGTAFLHSVMIQEKRRMLKIWNVVLIVLTFALCIFGTFLTRSGVVSSVHAFARTHIGPYFLFFIAISVLFAFSLLFWRRKALRSEAQLDSILSRESAFLLNNLVLLGACFAVFWGTIFPVISEAVRGVKITVGPPFFNKVNIPIGLFLLFLTGVGPLIAWRKASRANLRRAFLVPILVSLATLPLFLLGGIRDPYALMTFVLSVFVTVTIVMEFYKGVLARRKMVGEPWLVALLHLVRRNKRRYGGYIVHFGVVLVFVGLAGAAFNVSKDASLQKGETIEIRDYTLTYQGLTETEEPHYSAVIADVELSKGGRKVATLHPEKRFYHRRPNEPTSEVAIHSTLRDDVYLVLAGWNEGKAIFKVYLNPLVQWLWIGGYILALGTVIAMFPDSRRVEATLRRS